MATVARIIIEFLDRLSLRPLPAVLPNMLPPSATQPGRMSPTIFCWRRVWPTNSQACVFVWRTLLRRQSTLPTTGAPLPSPSN
jgi:hypothetical protein